MLITSNTGYFGPGDPILRRGLSGLGANVLSAETTPFMVGDTSIDPAAVTAANGELYFLTNWWRGVSGQAPLAASQYAPAVSVGLDAQTQNMVLLGGAALLAVFLLKGKRGKKRRR